MLDSIADQLLPRLTEASTWLGIVTAIGNIVAWAKLPPEAAGQLSAVLAGVSSLALMWMRERERRQGNAQ